MIGNGSEKFGDAAVKAGVIFATGALLGIGMNALSNRPLPVAWQSEATSGDDAPGGGIQGVSLEELRATLDSGEALAVDARHAALYAEGHIPGAINIAHDRIDRDMNHESDHMASKKVLVVYCASPACDNARVVAMALLAKGMPDVRIFKGGWKRWSEADLPKEKSP